MGILEIFKLEKDDSQNENTKETLERGELVKGKVKWFNVKRGLGFITCEDGREAFVHYGDIDAEGFKVLRAKQTVECELEETEKGLRAKHVKRIVKEA